MFQVKIQRKVWIQPNSGFVLVYSKILVSVVFQNSERLYK